MKKFIKIFGIYIFGWEGMQLNNCLDVLLLKYEEMYSILL